MAVTIPIGLMNEKSDKLHVKLGKGKRSMKLVYRGARLHHHRVEVAGRHVPKHPYQCCWRGRRMRQSGAMNTCTWRTSVFWARFACDAFSPCRKRSVATYSPTCAPTSGRRNGALKYGRMATGGRNNLCWTNHEAARNHHRHHERGNKRPYQPKHSPSIKNYFGVKDWSISIF